MRLRLREGEEYGPALLCIKFVTHVLGELLGLVFRLCIVSVNHEILHLPETPREILEMSGPAQGK
jgi:hypothetical protein